jgi:hypothetical protein
MNTFYEGAEQAEENCIMRRFIIHSLQQILLRQSNQSGGDGRRHMARKGGRKTHTKFQQENMKGRDDLRDLCVNVRIILKRNIKEIGP